MMKHYAFVVSVILLLVGTSVRETAETVCEGGAICRRPGHVAEAARGKGAVPVKCRLVPEFINGQ